MSSVNTTHSSVDYKHILLLEMLIGNSCSAHSSVVNDLVSGEIDPTLPLAQLLAIKGKSGDVVLVSDIPLSKMEQILKEYAARQSKGPSKAAKERRRERNKLLARKTRQRKKCEHADLHDELVALLLENEKLKKAVKERLSTDISAPLLHSLAPLSEITINFVKRIVSADQNASWYHISAKERSFCVADARLEEFPLVFVSEGFCSLTGYTASDCVGRSLRSLQDPETDKSVVAELREFLGQQKDCQTILRHTTKDTESLWVKLALTHLYDETKKARFIVGTQTKIEDENVLLLLPKSSDGKKIVQKGHPMGEKSNEGEGSQRTGL